MLAADRPLCANGAGQEEPLGGRDGRDGSGGERSATCSPTCSHARGQSLVEYTLLFALIFLVVIGTVIVFGPAIGSEFSNIKSQL